MAGTSDIIAHYGILGMKWGRSKGKSSSSSSSKPAVKRSPNSDPDAKAVNAIKSKASARGTNSLSNKELQTAITRMNLEKQFTDLQKPSGASQSATSKFLKDNGKQVVADLAKSYAKQAAKAAISSAVKAAASAIKN